MIERKFIAERIKEFQIQEYITQTLNNVGHSHTKLQRTPLGEKIIIFASRPGLIVGRSGESIKKLTKNLKKRFKLENPQIEINEVENVNLNAKIVAENIASSLEKFGTQRFKGVGHKTMGDVMSAGARGIEIIISGKIPGARAKSWRFYSGYLKKCGDLAITSVDVAYTIAKLKTGIIGIQVRIMPADIILPDKLELMPPQEVEEKEIRLRKQEEERKKEEEGKKKKKNVKKRASRKRIAKTKKTEEKQSKKAEVRGKRKEKGKE